MNNRIQFLTGQLNIDHLMRKKLIVFGTNKKTKIKIRHNHSDIMVTIVSELNHKSNKPGTHHLTLKYQLTEDSPVIESEIGISVLKSNFKYGGTRLLFHCPIINERVKILYLCDITHLFVCKYGITYIDDYKSRVNFKMPLLTKDSIEKYKQAKAKASQERLDRIISEIDGLEAKIGV